MLDMCHNAFLCGHRIDKILCSFRFCSLISSFFIVMENVVDKLCGSGSISTNCRVYYLLLICKILLIQQISHRQSYFYALLFKDLVSKIESW